MGIWTRMWSCQVCIVSVDDSLLARWRSGIAPVQRGQRLSVLHVGRGAPRSTLGRATGRIPVYFGVRGSLDTVYTVYTVCTVLFACFLRAECAISDVEH